MISVILKIFDEEIKRTKSNLPICLFFLSFVTTIARQELRPLLYFNDRYIFSSIAPYFSSSEPYIFLLLEIGFATLFVLRTFSWIATAINEVFFFKREGFLYIDIELKHSADTIQNALSVVLLTIQLLRNLTLYEFGYLSLLKILLSQASNSTWGVIVFLGLSINFITLFIQVIGRCLYIKKTS